MSKWREIQGVLPVLSTPFNANDEIDREILEREIDWVLGLGADGVTTGMVSEILRLSPSERMYLHEIVAARCHGKAGKYCIGQIWTKTWTRSR